MIKVFWRHILPLILTFAICEEALFIGVRMFNTASDLGVLGGSILILVSVLTFCTYLVRLVALPLLKELDL